MITTNGSRNRKVSRAYRGISLIKRGDMRNKKKKKTNGIKEKRGESFSKLTGPGAKPRSNNHNCGKGHSKQ